MKILSGDALSQVTGGASAFGGWSSWMVENRNEFTSRRLRETMKNIESAVIEVEIKLRRLVHVLEVI